MAITPPYNELPKHMSLKTHVIHTFQGNVKFCPRGGVLQYFINNRNQPFFVPNLIKWFRYEKLGTNWSRMTVMVLTLHLNRES